MPRWPAQDRPAEQAAADVNALLSSLPALRRAVEVAERAAADLLAEAQATREQLKAVENALTAVGTTPPTSLDEERGRRRPA
jgi:hypothetical protein